MAEPPACNQTVLEYELESRESFDGLSTEARNETFETLCSLEDYTYFNKSAVQNWLMVVCYHTCFQTCPKLIHSVPKDDRVDYLIGILDKQRNENAIPLSIIIGALCIFGTVANALTVVVIKKSKVLQATSHYLLSLAVSDLLILTCTGPLEIKLQLTIWPYYSDLFCRLHPFLKEACTFTTVLHIVAFTIERYIVICHPMRAKTLLSATRASRIIVLIWIVGFLCAVPTFLWHYVYEVCEGIPESGFCSSEEYDTEIDLFYTITLVVLFVIPMTVIIVLYGLIARTLFAKNLMLSRRTSYVKGGKHRVHSDGTTQRDQRRDAVEKARHQAVKLLALIAICFFMLWFPYHIIRSIPLFYPLQFWSEGFQAFYGSWLYTISIILLYLSSVSNPVLYNVMSVRFRKAFRRTIFCEEVRSQQLEYNTCMASTKVKTDTNSNASTHITSF